MIDKKRVVKETKMKKEEKKIYRYLYNQLQQPKCECNYYIDNISN